MKLSKQIGLCGLSDNVYKTLNFTQDVCLMPSSHFADFMYSGIRILN